ncbi:helix-turn-helix domain-containing protein [Chryseobacterium hispalense]|uniref:helix-turn-helix domain-containing protein n=1 Tax=Chryseobacterium hispalense TaxID=1453492 RepID=UPI00391C8C76
MKNQSHLPLHQEQLMTAILEIFSEILLHLEKSKKDEVQYYDSADVKRLLNISDSTLFRIRKSHKIPHIRIGRKIFYRKSFFTTALRK